MASALLNVGEGLRGKHRERRNANGSFPKLSQIKFKYGGIGGYAPPKGRVDGRFGARICIFSMRCGHSVKASKYTNMIIDHPNLSDPQWSFRMSALADI